jgi:uncharacterized membrane protein YoaK (UPF0700 family)
VVAHALDTDQAETIGIFVIVAVVVVGAIISAVITAVLGRVVVLVLVVVLAAYVWTQRSDISSAAKKCDATFLGVHLTPSNPTLKKHCQEIGR